MRSAQMQGSAELLFLLPLRQRNSHRVIGLLYRMRATAENKKQEEAIMFARMTADGRLLGFDIGDWSMLFGGCILAGLLAFLL